jgi:hypothetical protein
MLRHVEPSCNQEPLLGPAASSRDGEGTREKMMTYRSGSNVILLRQNDLLVGDSTVAASLSLPSNTLRRQALERRLSL